MGAADELKRLERELEGAERQLKPPAGGVAEGKPGHRPKRLSISVDIALAACALLVIGSVGIHWVRQLESERAKALQYGLSGAALGLLAGYAAGRLRV